jgi:hypothetical protein
MQPKRKWCESGDRARTKKFSRFFIAKSEQSVRVNSLYVDVLRFWAPLSQDEAAQAAHEPPLPDAPVQDGPEAAVQLVDEQPVEVPPVDVEPAARAPWLLDEQAAHELRLA